MNPKVKENLNRLTSLNGKAPKTITRLMRYSATGIFTGIIDLIIFIFLVEIFQFHYLLSAFFVFIVTKTLAFFVNLKWGFKDSNAKRLNAYYYFIVISIVELVLTIFLLKYLVEVLKIYYIFSKVIAGIITGMLGFSMNYVFTFQTKRQTYLEKSVKIHFKKKEAK